MTTGLFDQVRTGADDRSRRRDDDDDNDDDGRGIDNDGAPSLPALPGSTAPADTANVNDEGEALPPCPPPQQKRTNRSLARGR